MSTVFNFLSVVTICHHNLARRNWNLLSRVGTKLQEYLKRNALNLFHGNDVLFLLLFRCCCFFVFCFFSSVPEEFSLSEDKFVKFVKKRKSAEKLCTYIYLLHKTSRPVEHFWKLASSATCFTKKKIINWLIIERYLFYSESKEFNYISYRQVSLQSSLRSLSFHSSVIATNLPSCLAA